MAIQERGNFQHLVEKDAMIPFLYWVRRDRGKDFLAAFEESRFGVEVGFGTDPIKPYELASDIPWLLFELDGEDFEYVRNNIGWLWQINGNERSNSIYMVNAVAGSEIVNRAEIVVYQNLDYRNMRVPSYENLGPGQRLIFAVTHAHIGELGDQMSRVLGPAGYKREWVHKGMHHDFPWLGFYPNDPVWIMDVVKM
jgi:hypothetical protein